MKKKYWLKYLLDLLVVIIGVTIAFGLNSWRESSRESAQEDIYIESLQNDLSKDLEMLEDLIARQELNLSRINLLIEMKHSGEIVADSLSPCFRSMNYSIAFTPLSTTFRSLESSGKMDIISDFALRKELISYYDLYCAAIEQIDDDYKQHTARFAAPFFMEYAQFNERGQIGPSIMEAPNVINIIYSQYSLTRSRIQLYKKTQKSCQELYDKLQEA